MKRRFSVLSHLAALASIACLATAAFAQEAATTQARPMFERLRPVLHSEAVTPATPLTTWNGSFVFQGVTYNYNMVGAAPSTGKSTTIPVFIIPVVLNFKTSHGTTTFQPVIEAIKRTDGRKQHHRIADLQQPGFQVCWRRYGNNAI